MNNIRIELQPIEFDEILNYISENVIEIPTLGGRSKIKINKKDNSIVIINSNKKSLIIDKLHWGKVMDRMDNLEQIERGKTSRYAYGSNEYNWNECPNKIFSPYVPAIVKHMNHNRN